MSVKVSGNCVIVMLGFVYYIPSTGICAWLCLYAPAESVRGWIDRQTVTWNSYGREAAFGNEH